MKKRKHISKTRRQIIFARDRFSCVYCGESASQVSLEYNKSETRPYLKLTDKCGREFEIDHVVPVYIKDDNSISNLATACWRCNNIKSCRRWKFTPYLEIITRPFKKS